MSRYAFMAASALFIVAHTGGIAHAEDFDHRLGELHRACEAGNRGACVKFGIILGKHEEHRAEWRQHHPEWYWYEH